MTGIRPRKILEISAIVASLLVFLSITVVSFSLPNYSLFDGYVSFLGSSASPFRTIINISFALSGFIMLLLGYVLSESLKTNEYAKLGKMLLMISGILLILLAIFPTDPGGQGTIYGRLHQMIGNLAYILIPISIVAFGAAFRKEKGWGNLFANSSFALAAVTLLCSLILKFIPFSEGLLERIGMGADLLWMVLISFHLYQKEQRILTTSI